MHVKDAANDHPVTEELRTRWSPRAFADKPVPKEALLSMLEAARWAPSCYNEQPWRFLVATKDDPEQFEKLLGCLFAMNQEWARSAPMLMITVARSTFTQGGKPNRHALHDVGQAIAQLTVQARAQGLYVHQMAGFSQKKAREAFNIPDDHEPVAAVAVGYPGDPQGLTGDFKEMETAARERNSLESFVFTGEFGTPSPLVK